MKAVMMDFHRRFRVAMLFWCTLSITGMIMSTNHRPGRISYELVQSLQQDAQKEIKYVAAAADLPSFDFNGDQQGNDMHEDDGDEQQRMAGDEVDEDALETQSTVNPAYSPPFRADATWPANLYGEWFVDKSSVEPQTNHVLPYLSESVIQQLKRHKQATPIANEDFEAGQGSATNVEGVPSNAEDEAGDKDLDPVQQSVPIPEENRGYCPVDPTSSTNTNADQLQNTNIELDESGRVIQLDSAAGPSNPEVEYDPECELEGAQEPTSSFQEFLDNELHSAETTDDALSKFTWGDLDEEDL